MSAEMASEAEFLTVRLGGGSAGLERLLLVGRPTQGLVEVREWTSNSWNTEGSTYTKAASALLAEVEDAAGKRIPVSEELPAVRRWLVGG